MRMRYGRISVLLIAALALSFALFRAQPSLAETTPQEQPGTLSVTGYGVLTVKYDTATIQLGVTEERQDAGEAYAAMSNAMNKVAATIQAKGIKEDDLKTGMFTIESVYDYKDGVQVLRGYRATNTVIITTQALDKVPEIIQTAVAQGSNRLHGVTFSIKDTDALTNEALDLAVANARSKAERVAKNLNVTLVRARNISVQEQGRIPTWQWGGGGVSYAPGKAMDAAPAPVFSGTGEFTATVAVTFEVR